MLAPHLPLAVPLPVAAGEPEEAFPYPWGVVQWLPGELATLDRLDDPVQAALDLAAFVRALQAVDPTGGPTHSGGSRSATRTRWSESGSPASAARSTPTPSPKRGTACMAAPDYDGPPVWFHGDLAYLNLLAQDGKLSAVIDWGTCGVGDPRIETRSRGRLFPPDARQAYRGRARRRRRDLGARQGLGAHRRVTASRTTATPTPRSSPT